MPEPLLHALIRDTLSYLKDPLLPKQTLFASAQECALFQRVPLKEVVPSVVLKEVVPSVIMPPPQDVRQAASVKEPPPKQEAAASEEKKSVSPDFFSQVKKTLLRIAPFIQVTDEVPDDAEAKKIASAWREKVPDVEVVLLACERDEETVQLLKSLAKAIDTHLGKAKIIPAERLEREDKWDLFLQKNSFRLILASQGMQGYPKLMQFYTQDNVQFFLDKTPLLPLVVASHYKALEHKALLWKTLCQMLKK